MIDFAIVEIRALDPDDDRVIAAKVAGPAALLVAKLHKLGERDTSNPDRLVDKDAHDVYRLLASHDTDALAHSLRVLLGDPIAGAATRVALTHFARLFAAGPDALGCTMAARAETLLGNPAVARAATAALAHDLAGALASAPP